MSQKKRKVEKELDRIRTLHRGVLRARDVVAYARKKQSPLHSYFEWVDTKAAEQYRLLQARNLIRVYVKVVDDQSPPVRAYVSLRKDRTKTGGGYRAIEAVMASPARRDQLLSEALEELEYFQEKYKQLGELAEVFSAIKKVKKRRHVA